MSHLFRRNSTAYRGCCSACLAAVAWFSVCAGSDECAGAG
ncbi:MAG: hypothetical protein EXR27_00905 [Betaproteobacteria bacterium]|nr:hypothetical protein [Betaproteobacteria bacterium]